LPQGTVSNISLENQTYPGVSLSDMYIYCIFDFQAVCRPVVRSTYSATKALGKCAIKK
jgi:hypothetical protein